MHAIYVIYFFFPRRACKIAMGHTALSLNNNNNNNKGVAINNLKLSRIIVRINLGKGWCLVNLIIEHLAMASLFYRCLIKRQRKRYILLFALLKQCDQVILTEPSVTDPSHQPHKEKPPRSLCLGKSSYIMYLMI